MIEAFRDVLAFELASGRPAPEGGPGEATAEEVRLYEALIDEEAGETLDAFKAVLADIDEGRPPSFDDLAELGDGLGDTIWVCLAAAVRLRLDLPAIWGRIDAANMAKFGPGSWTDQAGKVRKPPGWAPPDVLGVIRDQRPIMETYGS